MRIVHEYAEPAENQEALAELTLAQINAAGAPVKLQAKNEGAWGNQLRAVIKFQQLPVLFDATHSTNNSFALPDVDTITPGALVRLRRYHPTDGTIIEDEQRFIRYLERTGTPDQRNTTWIAQLDGAVLSGVPDSIDLITATCVITDTASGVTETFTGLSLSAGHPNSLATTLYRKSSLVNPHADWAQLDLTPLGLDAQTQTLSQRLQAIEAKFADGSDRYSDIIHSDFFDGAINRFASTISRDTALHTASDPDSHPLGGVYSLVGNHQLAMLCTPDLYIPQPLVDAGEPDPITPLSNAKFAPCVTVQPHNTHALPKETVLSGLILDPQD